ncbi:hypothetical protein SAMN04488527_101233 [Aliiroseovarius crassostreae]|uniref:DUF937 domain-containing protein n=1 Tax=Aliiroseovarius crassostreae TaxID=154981 RepID=A0A0P7J7A5_9RHOB|nr:DUF937 domain-containing protein [Aliiroseovarius crassostreae]KPN64234.1 hypothetical protein AKJ29_16490 [Aliiroseovarius crassostreae]SFU30606.1 hypothetical protein SAMN04488527_101233 [Aliiroseovarius crassostreae]
MSLLHLLQQAQNGQGLSVLAEQIGLDPAQATQLTEMLAPQLGQATKAQVENGGLSGVIGALQGQEQAALYEDASLAASAQGQAQGAQFLTGILGDKGTQSLAKQAARSTGIELDQIAAFLPALAAMAQGGLQKSMPDEALSTMLPDRNGAAGLMSLVSGVLGKSTNDAPKSGPALDLLTSFLDADGDGSVMDDILGKIQG